MMERVTGIEPASRPKLRRRVRRKWAVTWENTRNRRQNVDRRPWRQG